MYFEYMKSMIKMLSVAFFTIALLSVVITTAGCDDSVWEKVDNANAPMLLIALDILSRVTYTLDIELTTTSMSAFDITVYYNDGKSFTISSDTRVKRISLKNSDSFMLDSIEITNGVACTDWSIEASGTEERRYTISATCDLP